MRIAYPLSAEPLEARIAPASITFTDVDGDTITVTSSLGTDAQLDAAVHRTASGSGFAITDIVLDIAAFQGTDISVTSDVGGSGDGFVSVGYIDGTGRDLHDVTVDGHLGRIRSGDGDTSTAAIHFLTVESFGVPAGAKGSAGPSRFDGAVEKIEIHGDLNKAAINVRADVDADGTIASIIVEGSMIGGATKHAGAITASGDIGSAEIGGDLRGGKGEESGSLGSFSKLGNVLVLGDVKGGTGFRSGAIVSRGGIDNVSVGGNLKGGAGNESGAIGSLLRIEQVTIGMSVLGGSGQLSGAIASADSLGTVAVGGPFEGGEEARGGVGGDLRGGSGKLSGAIGSDGDVDSVTVNGSIIGGSGARSGFISSFGDLGSVNVHGALIGSLGSYSGAVFARGDISIVALDTVEEGSMLGGAGRFSGSISALQNIGNVFMPGAIRAGSAPTDFFAASISARGIISGVSAGSIIGKTNSRITIAALDESHEGTSESITLGSVSVSGSVEFANILAGQTTRPMSGHINQNKQVAIGSVSIEGGIKSTTILAGVISDPLAVFNGFTAPNLSKALVSKSRGEEISFIGNVQVGGGAAQSGVVAIVAEFVSGVQIGSSEVSLEFGSNNDRKTLAEGELPNVFVNEGFRVFQGQA